MGLTFLQECFDFEAFNVAAIARTMLFLLYNVSSNQILTQYFTREAVVLLKSTGVTVTVQPHIQ
jgi:hypothetical protein